MRVATSIVHRAIPGSALRVLALAASVAAVAGCSDASTEPGSPDAVDLLVLNSTGQTLAAFTVNEGIRAAGVPTDLGAGFDGSAFDVSPGFAVSTVSSFGGSRVVFVDLGAGSVTTATFPAPEADQANPSAATFDATGAAWVGGRGSDAVYRARPGDPVAERIAEGVGRFIERVLPVGDRLYVVDANIDDEGGTYAPVGPGRVVVLSRSGEQERVIDLPAGAVNPTDAVAVGGRLYVLAAGSFDPGTFLPTGDGSLVVIDLESGAVVSTLALEANGVELEVGGDDRLYLTVTSNFEQLDLLRFDPIGGAFGRGPGDPLVVRGEGDDAVDCWVATGLPDGRIVCATFSFAEAGRLVLSGPDGGFLGETASGFGSTDVALR